MEQYPYRADAIGGLIALAIIVVLALLLFFGPEIKNAIARFFRAVVPQSKHDWGMVLGWGLLFIGLYWMFEKYIHPIFTGEWWK
jgi:hypothetical protein